MSEDGEGGNAQPVRGRGGRTLVASSRSRETGIKHKVLLKTCKCF